MALVSDNVIIRTDATINSGDTVEIEVGEDIGATGNVDTTVVISVQDGVNEYEVESFDGRSNNDYYIWGNTFQTASETQTPKIHGIHIDIVSTEPVAELYGRVESTQNAITILLYDPADLDDPRFQARTPDGQIVSFALVPPDESPLHCRTPDGVVHGVQVSDS